jgi:hypothetical protein
MKETKLLWVLVLGFSLMGCSKSGSPGNVAKPVEPAAGVTVSNSPAPEPTVPPPSGAAPRALKTEMRNVMFHLTDRSAAHLETLSGELWPTGKNEVVVFDDKTSFEVRVTNGTVSVTPDSLAQIMNDYVFARNDAPLKDIAITIDKDQLIIKGKLHNKGDIPFTTAGTVSTTPDGRLRVHTDKVSALHVPMKGMMALFGIELANVVNTSKIDGIDTDKNDLLLDLGTLLPPPHIRGKPSGVRIDKDAIVVIFGDGGKSLPPPTEKGNYMTFEGGPVRFGKLFMREADLTILDMDPGDPLDWNQDHYKDQLVAGYSKIKPNFGLVAFVKDYSKLGLSRGARATKVPAG